MLDFSLKFWLPYCGMGRNCILATLLWYGTQLYISYPIVVWDATVYYLPYCGMGRNCILATLLWYGTKLYISYLLQFHKIISGFRVSNCCVLLCGTRYLLSLRVYF